MLYLYAQSNTIFTSNCIVSWLLVSYEIFLGFLFTLGYHLNEVFNILLTSICHFRH